jgi:hypothetical protein
MPDEELNMRTHHARWILLPTLFFAALITLAQTAGNPFDTLVIRRYWNPVVGAGAVYEVTNPNGRKHTEEFDIFSEEKEEGKTAYWLGFAEESSDLKGKVYVKTLVIPEGFEARKLIIQFPGKAAMEMPVQPSPQIPKEDPKSAPKLVGTESITVPAGTFECEHWRYVDNSETWLSAKVAPVKVVKSASKDETRVLVKTISHAKDYITGPIKPFDPEAIQKLSQPQSK